MAKPLFRAQVLENRAFLKVLRRTGNVRLACRELGLKYGTMQHRRRVHPALAPRWDAALAFAQAKFNATLKKEEERQVPDHVRDDGRKAGPLLSQGNESVFRTSGGEPVLRRTRNGKLQLQRAQPGKLTRECEQAFLAALSATANIRLSAAAAGAAAHAFYRRRKQSPGFAREFRMALQQGYDALEMALLESSTPGAFEHDDWRRNDPPAMPPMTPDQALQLMYLHQKEARLLAEPDHIKRRLGESSRAHSERLAQMAEERDRRALEEFVVAEAERWAQGLPPWGPAGEDVRRKLLAEGRIVLADLAHVTGWSNADPAKAPHHEGRALFGGWRIEDMERSQDDDGWWDG